MSAMPKRIVLGTKNDDKIRELKELLKGSGVDVLSLKDFPGCPEAVESGKTFEANACKKASFYSLHTGLPALADDSGLVVPCLRGRPGVYSARFAGRGCTYEDNCRKLLRLLEGVPAARRRAKFVCVAAWYEKGKRIRMVRGECAGRIAFSIKGKNGFGYDPVFVPQGFSKTFAELSPKTKNHVSHRGKAFRAVKRFLLNYCGTSF